MGGECRVREHEFRERGEALRTSAKKYDIGRRHDESFERDEPTVFDVEFRGEIDQARGPKHVVRERVRAGRETVRAVHDRAQAARRGIRA